MMPDVIGNELLVDLDKLAKCKRDLPPAHIVGKVSASRLLLVTLFNFSPFITVSDNIVTALALTCCFYWLVL